MTQLTVVPISRAEEARRKLDAFCSALYNGRSKTEAYIEAGFSPNGAKDNVKKYFRQHHEYIQGYIQEKIGGQAPAAIKVIVQIMNNEEEKGGIRLKAAQDLLDRAGYNAKQKVELTTKDTKDMSTEELRGEIQKLLQEDPSLAKVFTL